jgi:hypothetical protein
VVFEGLDPKALVDQASTIEGNDCGIPFRLWKNETTSKVGSFLNRIAAMSRLKSAEFQPDR